MTDYIPPGLSKEQNLYRRLGMITPTISDIADDFLHIDTDLITEIKTVVADLTSLEENHITTLKKGDSSNDRLIFNAAEKHLENIKSLKNIWGLEITPTSLKIKSIQDGILELVITLTNDDVQKILQKNNSLSVRLSKWLIDSGNRKIENLAGLKEAPKVSAELFMEFVSFVLKNKNTKTKEEESDNSQQVIDNKG